MKKFDFQDYLILNDNQLLKLKLKGQAEWIWVCRTWQSVLQSFQPDCTPISKINLEVVKDLTLYKVDKNDYENHFEISVEPKEIEEFELVEV